MHKRLSINQGLSSAVYKLYSNIHPCMWPYTECNAEQQDLCSVNHVRQ